MELGEVGEAEMQLQNTLHALKNLIGYHNTFKYAPLLKKISPYLIGNDILP